MKNIFKILTCALLPFSVVGCKKDADIQNESLYLYDFYCTKEEQIQRTNSAEKCNKVEFESTNALIPCEALVVNKNRDSFVDIVVYTSWNNKYVVYNEGNGDYTCSSTTEYDGKQWNTKINFTIEISGEHSQNGFVSVKDITFLHSGSKKSNAELNKSKNLSINYHEHRYSEQIEKDEYVYQVRDHFHATRFYYSCECGLSEEHNLSNPTDHYFECDEAPIEHTYNLKIISDRYLAADATCTKPAKYYWSCECGEHNAETFEYGEPLGHDFSFFKSNDDETMENDGTKTIKCSRCGVLETAPNEGSAIKNGSIQNLIIKDGKVEGYRTYYNDERDNFVVLPSYVTVIASYAFAGCQNIKSIEISENVVEIKEGAFKDCNSLTSLRIPSSVRSMGNGALSGCSSLVSLSLPFTGLNNTSWEPRFGVIFGQSPYPNSVKISQFYGYNLEYEFKDYYLPSSLKEVSITALTNVYFGAFSNCSMLESITFEGGLSSIGPYAFYNCTSLVSTNIPSGVTEIREYAFYYCSSLTSLVIPSSVVKVDKFAFGYCSKYLVFYCEAESPTKDCDLSSAIWNYVDSYLLDGVFYALLGDGTFTVARAETRSVTKVNIPNEIDGKPIVSVARKAFYNCDLLETVLVGTNVVSIDEYAFAGCASLKSISFPDNLQFIGGAAFSHCESLQSISLGDSITAIESYAFDSCLSLTALTIPMSVSTIGYRPLYRCTNLVSLTLPFLGTTQNKPCPFSEIIDSESAISLKYVKIKGGLLSESAFRDYTTIESIELDNINFIPEYAFYGCTSLKSISLPEGLQWIRASAFRDCSSLKSITIPNTIISCGIASFMGCTSLTSISLPEGITSIEDSTFKNCSSLKSITIPESVTSIGQHAFDGCTSLTSISLPEGITKIEQFTFQDCSSLMSFVIPNGVQTINQYAFRRCSSLISINIPNTVLSIGTRAFSECVSLPTIWIPKSVDSIGFGAFSDCSSLTINCEIEEEPTGWTSWNVSNCPVNWGCSTNN